MISIASPSTRDDGVVYRDRDAVIGLQAQRFQYLLERQALAYIALVTIHDQLHLQGTSL
jgi:hypothetical protein